MRVRIYQPGKTATQSGRAKGGLWVLEPEKTTPRRPDGLMGWTTAGDGASALAHKLFFYSLADAIAFARREGWTLALQRPQRRRVVPKSYIDLFNPRRVDGDDLP